MNASTPPEVYPKDVDGNPLIPSFEVN